MELSVIAEYCVAGFATRAREPHKPRAPIQSRYGRRIDHPCRVFPRVHTCRRSQAGTGTRIAPFSNPTQYVPQIAQQTALRAAFLVDQAIQEKQVFICRLIVTPSC
jgi:hypothetical protein